MGKLSPYSREIIVRRLCQDNENLFSVKTTKSILRDHNDDICMHAEFETRGSQISSLSRENCRHWFIDNPFTCQREY